MTSPVAHGYPDFGRFQARADKILLTPTADVINAETVLPRLFVGDVPFVFFSLSPAVNNFRMRIDFYDQETAGIRFSGQAVSVRTPHAASWTIPVSGPWMEVTLTADAYPATYTLRMATAHSPYSGVSGEHTGNILISINTNIAAGGNTSVDTIRVWPGAAHWFVDSSVTSFRAELSTIDYLGTVTIIDMMRFTAAGADNHNVYLPPCDMRLTVFNSSAGASSFRAALVARPIEPGR